MVERLKKFGTFHGNSEILDSTMAISEMLGSLRSKNKNFKFQGGANKLSENAFKNSETGLGAAISCKSAAKVKKEKS